MIYFSYLLTGLALIVLKSLVPAALLPPGLTYDLLIPLVVYLSLFQTSGKSLLLILFLGLIMDSVTGGAMGIYMLTYFWLFVAVQLAIYFLQKDNFLLMITAIVLGVLLENGFFVIVDGLSGKAWSGEADMTGKMVGQLIGAVFTGPVLLGVLKWGYRMAAANPDVSKVDLPETAGRRKRRYSPPSDRLRRSRGCGRNGSSED